MKIITVCISRFQIGEGGSNSPYCPHLYSKGSDSPIYIFFSVQSPKLSFLSFNLSYHLFDLLVNFKLYFIEIDNPNFQSRSFSRRWRVHFLKNKCLLFNLYTLYNYREPEGFNDLRTRPPLILTPSLFSPNLLLRGYTPSYRF